MAEQKLTREFPVHIKPVHIGVYPTTFRCSGKVLKGYSHWDGEQWSNQAGSPGKVRKGWGLDLANQNKTWRGLTEQSK